MRQDQSIPAHFELDRPHSNLFLNFGQKPPLELPLKCHWSIFFGSFEGTQFFRYLVLQAREHAQMLVHGNGGEVFCVEHHEDQQPVGVRGQQGRFKWEASEAL